MKEKKKKKKNEEEKKGKVQFIKYYKKNMIKTIT